MFPATYTLVDGSPARDLVSKQLEAFRDNFGRRQHEYRQAQEPHALRRADHRLAGRARGAARPGAPADRVGDLQPAAGRHAAGDRRDDPVLGRATGSGRSPVRARDADGPTTRGCARGLPPTPIGNPGLESIKAAARPAETQLPVLRPQAGRERRARVLADEGQVPARRAPLPGSRAGSPVDVAVPARRLRVAGRPLALAGDAQRRAARRGPAPTGATCGCRSRPSCSRRPCAACRRAAFAG